MDLPDAADSIPKVVSFVVAFPKVASFVVFPKVVSLVGLTEVPWTFPGGNLTEDDCSGGDFRNETFPGGGDLTPEEVCPLLGGDFGDLTKELGFLTGGASRKLLPFDAAGFDLINIYVILFWHACYYCHHHHVFFSSRILRTLLLSSLGFPGCWLVNQLFLEEESVKLKKWYFFIIVFPPGAGVVHGSVSRISSLSDSKLFTTSISRSSIWKENCRKKIFWTDFS